MKLMIDTNIILDVLMQREVLYEASAQVLRVCNSGVHTGLITSNSVCDIFYITRKTIRDRDKLYQVMEGLCSIFSLCDVTGSDVSLALAARAKDFEDCLLAECAKRSGCDYIITRNGKDFKNFGIPTLTPEGFLSLDT